MQTAEYFEKLLPYYEGSFDLEKPAHIQGREYAACGAFHAHVDKYVLVKKAQIWAVDSHEYCLFATYEQAPGQEEIGQLKKVMEEYMEPVLARKGQPSMPKDHMYTYLTLVLITAKSPDASALRAVKRFRFQKFYHFYLRGYSEGRIVLVDLEGKKIYTSRDGRVLRKFQQSVLKKLAGGV